MYLPAVKSYSLAFLFSIISTGSHAFPTILPRNNTEQLPELPSTNSYQIINKNGTWPYRTYYSTNLTSPVLNVTKTSPGLAPGLIFLTISDNLDPTAENQTGPVVLTSDGDLVWSAGDITASDLSVQRWDGEDVLTYWRSTGSGGAYGEAVVLNSEYEEVGRVCPELDVRVKEGVNSSCVVDSHEVVLTGKGSMLVPVYNVTQTDLTSVGGPEDGWVYDCLAVEVNITTNEVLWSWSGLEHVPVSDTKLALGNDGQNSSSPFGWFHMNSLQPFRDHVLINSRETWSSYYVNRNGSIEWTLDGADGGDFGPLPIAGNFSWQHHARVHPSPYTNTTNQLLWTAFADNNDQPAGHNESFALGLLLDLPPTKSNPPKVYSQLHDPEDPIVAFAEGSYQLLGHPHPNTSSFVGDGTSPTFKEYNAEGEVLYSADFGFRALQHSAQSYRALKYDWHATPSTRIDLVVKESETGGGYTGYVSWNGATDVEGYRVLAGQEEGCLEAVGWVRRRGFETGFEVDGEWGFVRVEAVEGGRVVGGSAGVRVG